MTPLQIIFWITSAMLLISALMVVTRRNLVHAALFLILTLFGVALIFGIMLTRNVTSDNERPFNKNKGLAGLMGVFVFSGLVVMLQPWQNFWAQSPNVDTSDSLVNLGIDLFSVESYLIPSIVASMLLFAVLIGGVMIVWRKKS